MKESYSSGFYEALHSTPGGTLEVLQSRQGPELDRLEGQYHLVMGNSAPYDMQWWAPEWIETWHYCIELVEETHLPYPQNNYSATVLSVVNVKIQQKCEVPGSGPVWTIETESRSWHDL